MMDQIGKMVVAVGVVLVIAGLVISFFDRVPLLGKLPGDIHVKRGDFHIYIPIATSIVLSVLLSLIFVIVSRFMRR